jgi:2'-5' RNA ligase
MPAEGRRRLFFALWPAAATAAALHAQSERARAVCGGRPTRRSDLHLTLAFLGDLAADRVPVAEAVAAEVIAAEFEFVLDRIGYWKHNRILWAGCSAEPVALVDLAQQLATRLRGAGFALESRAFAAHVTLLRNARCAELPPLHHVLPWRADAFVLAESAAAGDSRYSELRRWPLRSGARAGPSGD